MIPDRPPLYSFAHTLRSRYGETDKMGYVYYARYLEYFEVARTEMIRSMGISYRTIEENGVMLPVIESQIKYKAPVFYDDRVIIKVYIFDIPIIKLKTYYKMFTEGDEKLRAAGKVNLCFVSAKNRKPCRAPQLFIDKLHAVMDA